MKGLLAAGVAGRGTASSEEEGRGEKEGLGHEKLTFLKGCLGLLHKPCQNNTKTNVVLQHTGLTTMARKQDSLHGKQEKLLSGLP